MNRCKCGEILQRNIISGELIKCPNPLCPIPREKAEKPASNANEMQNFFTLEALQKEFAFTAEIERQPIRYLACPHCNCITSISPGWQEIIAHHLLTCHQDVFTELNVADTIQLSSTVGRIVLKERPPVSYKPAKEEEFNMWLRNKTIKTRTIPTQKKKEEFIEEEA